MKYDGEIIELAEKLTNGQGDGRLSVDDAGQLFQTVQNSGTYTAIEKESLAYIRERYNWTEAADEWFRTELRKWALSK